MRDREELLPGREKGLNRGYRGIRNWKLGVVDFEVYCIILAAGEASFYKKKQDQESLFASNSYFPEPGAINTRQPLVS